MDFSSIILVVWGKYKLQSDLQSDFHCMSRSDRDVRRATFDLGSQVLRLSGEGQVGISRQPGDGVMDFESWSSHLDPHAWNAPLLD